MTAADPSARAEKESRESRERFELAVRGADDGLWDWDLQTGEVYFSPRWKGILGYEDHELPNRFEEWEKRIHPDDREHARRALQDHLEGLTPCYEFEHRLLHRDGSYRWVGARGVSLRGEDGKARRMAGAQWDITRKKKAEAELQESEARFRAVYESAPIGIANVDIEGCYVHTNRAFRGMLGYGADEIRGMSFEDVTHPEDVAESREVLEGLAEGKRDELSFEKRYRRKDGREIWCRLTVSAVRDASGGFLYTVSMNEDVTERKRAEEKLRESERRFRSLVMNSSDVTTVFAPDGTRIYASPSMRRILGYEPEAAIGGSAFDIVHPDDAPKIREEFAERTRRPGTGLPFEFRLRHADGSWRVFESIGTNLLDDPGVGGIAYNARDVTERRQTEGELRRRDAILQAVTFAAERFLGQAASWETSVQEVLERFGHATGVSRVYLFENSDGGRWATNTHEWTAPGIAAQIGNPVLETLPYEDPGFSRWAEVLGRGETMHGRVRDLPEGERPEPEAEGTLSYVLVPIFVEGEWWGFIGFDECVEEREWSAAETGALEAAANTLGAAMGRNRAERELERERDFSSAVVDTVGALVVVFDPEGRIVRFNRACERLTGYTFEEVRGRRYWELFLLPQDVAPVRAVMQEVAAGRAPNSNENCWVMRDGSRRLISWNNAALLDEEGRISYLIGAGIDITERRRAEDALKESQRALATLMSNLPGMAYRCRNDPDWTMEFVSEGCLELTGYDSGDLMGNRRKSYAGLIHPDDREAVWNDVQAAVHEDRPFQVTYRITTVSGEVKWVLEQGQGILSAGGDLLALEGFVTDVTERVQARELLERRVEERTRELSTLLEVSNDVASTLELEPLLGLILDQLRTVVDYTDSSLLVFEGEDLVTVGYRGPVPQGQIMGTRFPPGRGRMMIEGLGRREPTIIDDVRSDAPLARAYRQVVGEERLGRDFGHIRSWLGVPLVLKEQPVGLLAIIHDEPGYYADRHAELATAFANQAAVAIENARLYEQAQSAAALEERQRLARELHDSVSQALYGITLGADTARTLLEGNDPSRVAEPLDYVLSLAEAGLAEMRALIFELRPESLEIEGLVAALEKQAAALEVRHDIPVRADLCAEPGASPETKEALYRIAQEALHNTLKHARATGVGLKLEENPASLELEVSDDGAGFDPGGSFPGHLGLRSMRERAERLGGTLEVQSKPGQGTRVLARIPSGKRQPTH